MQSNDLAASFQPEKHLVKGVQHVTKTGVVIQLQDGVVALASVLDDALYDWHAFAADGTELTTISVQRPPATSEREGDVYICVEGKGGALTCYKVKVKKELKA